MITFTFSDVTGVGLIAPDYVEFTNKKIRESVVGDDDRICHVSWSIFHKETRNGEMYDAQIVTVENIKILYCGEWIPSWELKKSDVLTVLNVNNDLGSNPNWSIWGRSPIIRLLLKQDAIQLANEIVTYEWS